MVKRFIRCVSATPFRLCEIFIDVVEERLLGFVKKFHFMKGGHDPFKNH